MQKQQSIRDIQTLDRLKEKASTDPQEFARQVMAGNLTKKEKGTGFIEFSDDGDDDEEQEEGGQQKEEEEDDEKRRFEKIPKPQNVVRMPPINWAKYQIVGEPLDKMHEEQLYRPSYGRPKPASHAPPEYVLAAPYRPLVDDLGPPPPPLARAGKGGSRGGKT